MQYKPSLNFSTLDLTFNRFFFLFSDIIFHPPLPRSTFQLNVALEALCQSLVSDRDPSERTGYYSSVECQNVNTLTSRLETHHPTVLLKQTVLSLAHLLLSSRGKGTDFHALCCPLLCPLEFVFYCLLYGMQQLTPEAPQLGIFTVESIFCRLPFFLKNVITTLHAGSFWYEVL